MKTSVLVTRGSKPWSIACECIRSITAWISASTSFFFSSSGVFRLRRVASSRPSCEKGTPATHGQQCLTTKLKGDCVDDSLLSSNLKGGSSWSFSGGTRTWYASGNVFRILPAKLSRISLSMDPMMKALYGCRSERATSPDHSTHFHVKPKLLKWCENQSANLLVNSKSKMLLLR